MLFLGLPMLLEAIATVLLGGLFFYWGQRLGKVFLRKGATANDIFKGKNAVSLLFLGLYIALMVLALNVPQMQTFPLELRVYGMRITWTIMRIVLMGFCGLAFAVTWKTARVQVVAVVLLGLLGVGGFTAAEAYFLAPIHRELVDNLRPNGVFRQTSMSSCAPAALATVLQRWTIPATESSVAELAQTSRLGTSMPQLIVAAKAYRMGSIEMAATWEQMQRVNRPGVLGVWLDGNRRAPHAVALMAIGTEEVVIGDPARGELLVLNRAQFARIDRQQYVPIFREGETLLTATQAAQYLKRSGYSEANAANLRPTLQEFQQAMGIKVTGFLDSQTILLLMGPFLEGVPTLKDLPL
jgi:predicted double-glycine peptidase